MRYTIDDYANTFGLSKETIHAQLRTKQLNYIVNDGMVYIIARNPSQQPHIQAQALPLVQSNMDIIISLYQRENQQLKIKIKELETKIDSLIHDKESMLIAERQRIEEIYANKDEQLKNILETLNTKFAVLPHETVCDVDISDPSPISTLSDGVLELKRYLKFIGLTSQERKEVRRKFSERLGSDIRIIQKEGEFYVNLSQYDYTDLLKV
jgi:hypothetical protein